MKFLPIRGIIHSVIQRKRQRGQGLVEFALILALLLLLMMGIFDFGRALIIYTNLFNAAREGARYGAVHPWDPDVVEDRVESSIILVDPATVNITVCCDQGPGTATFYCDQDAGSVSGSCGGGTGTGLDGQAGLGDRIVVSATHSLGLITPLVTAFAQTLPIDTEAARTIATYGEAVGPPGPGTGGGGGGGGGATATPGGPTATTAPTQTPGGPTATTAPTQTPGGPTATPGAPPMLPIIINRPLCMGDTSVSGIARPGQNVYLRNVSTGYGSGSSVGTVVEQDNTFAFTGVPALAEGDLVVVQGYGYTDYALVIDCSVTPTPIPPTPGPTATPTGPYIVLSPTCSDGGSVTIIVRGYNWGNNQRIGLKWDGAFITGHNDFRTGADGSFQRSIVVDAAVGSHTIRAEIVPQGTPNASATYDVPCSLSGPNLIIDSLTLLTALPLQTYQPLQLRVEVSNIGNEAVNTLFWVDLYADEAPPTNTTSIAWTAIGSMGPGETRALTIEVPGFATVGDHEIHAYADSFDQVAEQNETDNVYGPLPITIASVGPTPTPTSTPSSETGSIAGITFLLRNMNVTPLARATVYCYQDATLIATAISNDDGSYELTDIPPATDYTLIAEAIVDGQLYRDEIYPVGVTAGSTTNIDLFLH